MQPRRPLLAVAAAAAAAALATVPSLAADPEGGKISTAAPKVTWVGSTTGGFATTFGQIFVNAAGEQQPCEAPSCDEFALELGDAGDLTVSVTAGTSTISYLQVIKPDGSAVFADGLDEEDKPDKTTVIKMKKAPTGAYKVQTAQNSLAIDDYTAFAQLGTAPAPAAPAPAVPPASSPPPSSPPPASSQPAPATLTVKAPKASARKLRRSRKLAVEVSTTQPVTDVRATLARKGKAIGTGRLARLEKAGVIRLKLKAPRPGTYDLVVVARQGARSVGTRIKVKIAR